jgi:TPR repeat protein
LPQSRGMPWRNSISASCIMLAKVSKKIAKRPSKWYRLAAGQGLPKAEYRLGIMYGFGQGVPLDKKEELKWYRMAAAHGNNPAQVSVGLMFEGGLGVPQDYVQAHMWYNLASAGGERSLYRVRPRSASSSASPLACDTHLYRRPAVARRGRRGVQIERRAECRDRGCDPGVSLRPHTLPACALPIGIAVTYSEDTVSD